MTAALPSAEAVPLQTLLPSTAQKVTSRVLGKSSGGSVTLFALGENAEITEHRAPVDVLALVLEGAISMTVGDRIVPCTPGTVVRLPASVPHAVRASTASQMLLIVLRDSEPA
jgi:quercetin dioxygenase-like cupin family protein